MLLAYRQFRASSIATFAEAQVAILRNYTTARITSNSPGGVWGKAMVHHCCLPVYLPWRGGGQSHGTAAADIGPLMIAALFACATLCSSPWRMQIVGSKQLGDGWVVVVWAADY